MITYIVNTIATTSSNSMNKIFIFIFFAFVTFNSIHAQESSDTLEVPTDTIDMSNFDISPDTLDILSDSLDISIDSLDISIDSLDILDYTEKIDYEIGSVKVIGAPERDPIAIKSIAGLKTGDKIKLPSLAISKAVKSLMRLRLFDDVQIIQKSVDGNIVHLIIVLVERPTLARYSYKGVKKRKHDDLNDIVRNILNKGGIVTDAQKNLAKKKITQYYVDKGKLDAKVNVVEIPDETKKNSVRLIFEIDKGERVKVQDITFTGNTEVSNRKLRKKMKNTKRKGTWFRKTKFIKEDYEEDKESVIGYYNSLGFRDARVINDSIWREDDLNICKVRCSMSISRNVDYLYLIWIREFSICHS